MNNIAKIRKANGIKQLALAKVLNWKVNRLSQYENNKRKVCTSDAQLIITAFETLGVNTSFESLFSSNETT